MSDGDAAVVLLFSEVGLVTKGDRQAVVCCDYLRGADGTVWRRLRAHGNEWTDEAPADLVALWEGRLFPGDPGDPGGGQPRAVREPVNLDGSRRNALRDRVALRGLVVEAMAAD